MSHLVVQPISKKEIYRITESLRNILEKYLNYKNSLYFPIVEFIELLPFIDTDFSYEYVSDNELPREYAMYMPLENTIKIRESVYIRATQRSGRDRFTLAHELGHYILHKDIRLLSFARQQERIPIYKDPEWQANTFASMLLMDPQEIKYFMPEEIAKCCGTSLQAATLALNNAKKSNYI